MSKGLKYRGGTIESETEDASGRTCTAQLSATRWGHGIGFCFDLDAVVIVAVLCISLFCWFCFYHSAYFYACV